MLEPTRNRRLWSGSQVLEIAEDPDFGGADSSSAAGACPQRCLRGTHLQLFPSLGPPEIQDCHWLQWGQLPPPLAGKDSHGLGTLIDSVSNTSSNVEGSSPKRNRCRFQKQEGRGSRTSKNQRGQASPLWAQLPSLSALQGSDQMILKVLPGKASSEWGNRKWAAYFPGRRGKTRGWGGVTGG